MARSVVGEPGSTSHQAAVAPALRKRAIRARFAIDRVHWRAAGTDVATLPRGGYASVPVRVDPKRPRACRDARARGVGRARWAALLFLPRDGRSELPPVLLVRARPCIAGDRRGPVLHRGPNSGAASGRLRHPSSPDSCARSGRRPVPDRPAAGHGCPRSRFRARSARGSLGRPCAPTSGDGLSHMSTRA